MSNSAVAALHADGGAVSVMQTFFVRTVVVLEALATLSAVPRYIVLERAVPLDALLRLPTYLLVPVVLGPAGLVGVLDLLPAAWPVSVASGATVLPDGLESLRATTLDPH